MKTCFCRPRLLLPGLTATAIIALLCVAESSHAAIWYVDNTATGANNGTSWANAWTSLSSVSPSAGDTVYISGGANGSSQTYPCPTGWVLPGGFSTSRITYQIGQDSQHDGTVIFSGSGTFLGSIQNVVISGYVTNDPNMHFRLSGFTQVWAGSPAHYRVCYFNFGTIITSARPVDLHNGTSDGEIDHTWLKLQETSGAAIDITYFLVGNGAAAFDTGVKFHDNYVYAPYQTSGNMLGTDCIRDEGTGNTIYNNYLIAYHDSAQVPGDHQDGVQNFGPLAYCKFYNNVIVDTGDSAMFFVSYFTPDNHLHIFNNIVVFTDSGQAATSENGGMGIQSPYQGSLPCAQNDVIVANNLSVACGQGWRENNYASVSATWTSCILANNISIQGPAADGDSANGVSVVSNIVMTAATAGTSFINYLGTTAGTNNNFRLLSGASSLRGKGTNLTAYAANDPALAKDFDGNVRPAIGNWDIGPFQYQTSSSDGPSTNPVISASPATINFGSVIPNITVTNGFTVQNTGAGILSGKATVSAPFSIISGGNYSLTNNQTQIVSVSYSPSGAASDSAVVSFTGGGGATASVTGQPVTVMPGLSFASYAGTIISPMMTNAAGYITETVDVSNQGQQGVTNGGSATYFFNITNAGQYAIQASVLAAGSVQQVVLGEHRCHAG